MISQFIGVVAAAWVVCATLTYIVQIPHNIRLFNIINKGLPENSTILENKKTYTAVYLAMYLPVYLFSWMRMATEDKAVSIAAAEKAAIELTKEEK